jgi:hypothetical protein
VKFRRREGVQDSVRTAIRTYQPATWHEQTMSYYFEIIIEDNFNISISMGFTDENFNNSTEIGHDSNSYGYDCKGMVSKTIGRITFTREFPLDLCYTTGDTVGAGVNYVTGEIFFTKNEKLVCWMHGNLKTTLYPTIGFSDLSESLRIKSKPTVQVNFKKPYVFYVSQYIQDSKPSNITKMDISKMNISS